MSVLTGGSIDGAIAYDQFTQSDDPYDPIFLKNGTGTAKVGALQVLHRKTSRSESSKSGKKTTKPDQKQPRN
jgi:hypothetical protein